MVIAQVTATKLKTHQELRYTTAAGAVIQLMGSDEQFSLVEFPIVLAYNRIHHYLPTAYLSDRSLANWRLAQMYKHFTAANEYFVESKASMEYEPHLVQALDAVFVGVTEVQRLVRDRAKLGSTAATSVPISLTGKKPQRSDILGRWSDLPKRDARLIPLPQPIFDNPADDPSLPDYIFQRRPVSVQGQPGPSAPVTTTAGQPAKTATVTTTAGQPAETATVTTTPRVSLTSGSTSTTSASKGVRPPPPPSTPGGVQISSSQSGRQKRKATKAPIIEEGEVDDTERDPDFVIQDEDVEEAEVQPSSSIVSGLSQQESVQKGIPQLPKKRAVVPESKKKYRCQVCNQGFQRTSELKDHNYTQHLGGSYSCAECLKSYVNEKGLKYHIKSIHKGEGKCKCTEEGCDWEDKDSGKLHQHLLTAHEIGDPLVLFWRMAVPAKKFSRIPGPSRPMLLSIWKKSLNVTFVTGTSPLKLTERCIFQGTISHRMMKQGTNVNIVAKLLTWNLSSTTTGTCTGYSIIRCFKLRKRKRQQRRPKERLVKKENPVLPKVVLQQVSLHL